MRKAAQQGYVAAQYELAERLYGGRGCKIDINEAYEWYKKAAEQGHSDAKKC